MIVTFYGVRGSMPAVGAEFTKYGGNTACVHIELTDGTDIVLDSGTGIVPLGEKLAQKDTPIHLLLTHNHWDHIQGFPFFRPAYQQGRQIQITPGLTEPKQDTAILEQMSATWFPISYQQLSADIRFSYLNGQDNWKIGSANISRTKINHPGGGSAYLIEDNGIKLAYITDNELAPPYPQETSYNEWLSFLQSVDLLIHDAQYAEQDMPFKHGWGHSVIEQTVELACQAKVKQCALYSHDISRTDQHIDRQLIAIDQYLTEHEEFEIDIFAAAEGMVIELNG
ncbi:MBL fold metallo-hydrolase [Catenovulum sp. 2E275]|uniref:MBL fold metallo-hydrolase n=1 Tax=Catenovulum sp. 2E275 TaxID=2980497 RepID=UPI0021D13872|nr:MBL fold metallo-hydrolase [Catenovulum sp. 2E275]MCU4676610.1 MBL fold metallo-hydrolase [Catenovulum sp. 2E275]